MVSILDFVNIYSVVGCAVVLLWYYSKSAYSFWRKLNVKYVEPVPFLGNTAKLFFRMAPFHEVYHKIYRTLQDEPYGGFYEIRRPQLLVKDPELVSAIMVKDLKHFYNRGFKQLVTRDKQQDPLAMHLFFAEDERWRVLRQKMSPVFTSGKLKQMHEQIMECVHLLTKYIDNRMDESGSLDLAIKGYFQKLTINVIGSCAFGIDCQSFESNEKFSQMCREAIKLRFMVTVRALISTISQSLANVFKITLMRKEVNDFFRNLVLDTVDYRRQNGVTRSDVLQLLMELQNSHVDPKFAVGDKSQNILENEEFDELDVAANAFLFFVAGFETTAATLSFCSYELALNQDVQTKLRSEVQKLKNKNQNLTYEVLREMTYLDAVISETLRKYPPAAVLSRECTEDYILPGTKTTLPAGTDVIIPIFSIQHDWKYFPNPEAFDPERFLGDNKNSHPNGAYLPFGDGPRFCLGKRFAEMEIKSALSEMILKYDIKPCTKTEIPLKFKKGSGVLQTTCGIWVNLVKRK